MYKTLLWLLVLTIKEGLFSDKIVILRKKAGRKGSGSLSEEGKVMQISNGIRNSVGDGVGAGDNMKTTYTDEASVQCAFLSQKP